MRCAAGAQSATSVAAETMRDMPTMRRPMRCSDESIVDREAERCALKFRVSKRTLTRVCRRCRLDLRSRVTRRTATTVIARFCSQLHLQLFVAPPSAHKFLDAQAYSV